MSFESKEVESKKVEKTPREKIVESALESLDGINAHLKAKK